MTEVTLHPTPRGRDVVLEQIRIVGLAFRREALGLAVLLGIGTLVIAIDIARGTAETWFDSDDWIQISIVSFFFPAAVWWRDRRFGPAFLWTLPVDRRRLALAKVFAGWVWLTIALAVFVGWQLALAVLSGVEDPETTPLIAFTGATAAYVIGSALLLGLRHPVRWLLGAAGVLFLLRILMEVFGPDPFGVDAFLRSNSVSYFLARASVLWTFSALGAGLIALWVAISRHRENR